MTQQYLEDLCSQLVKYDSSSFPKELKDKPYWLVWQAQPSPTEKNPYKILKNPLGQKWQSLRQTFNELKLNQDNQGYGFIYTDEHEYVCVDIDLATPLNDRLVQALQSYTEWSPSGEGLHVIVALTSVEEKKYLIEEFAKGKRNKTDARDLFISSGYVTITGLMPPFTKNKNIRRFSAEHLATLLRPYFSTNHSLVTHPTTLAAAKDKVEETRQKKAATSTAQSKEYASLRPVQVQNILRQMPVKCLTSRTFIDFPVLDLNETEESRDAWLIVGQALHNYSGGSIIGYSLWQEWSKEGNKYDQAALEASWKSFSENLSNKITMATLIKLIKAQQPLYADYSPKGALLPTLQNIDVFARFYNFDIRYNIASLNVEIRVPKHVAKLFGYDASEPVNSVSIATEIFISELIKQGFAPSSLRPVVKAYIAARSNQNTYSPIVEYFDKYLTEWDGVDRIEELLKTIQYPVGKRKAYLLFLKKWLIQVMAAVYTTSDNPNRLNSVLILQGAQGTGKTMWVESLFPTKIRQYCVGSKSLKMSTFRTDMVKLNMELLSTLICNVNEIDTVFDGKTYSDFKAFLDQTTDNIVLPYGDSAVQLLRRTVFIGSTNKRNFFVDETGNRRFTLIEGWSFNYRHNIDLDQLWSQALTLYKKGEKWWLDEFNREDNNALRIQAQTNSAAMDLGNERVVDMLDSMFDSDASINLWKDYTFQQICQVLDLSLRVNSREYNSVKRTTVLWLRTIPDAPEPRAAHNGLRAPTVYKMPPLKGEKIF